MCGIICGVARRDIVKVLIEGLYRLEYRGYDSVGIAVVDNNSILTRIRTLGKISFLLKLIKNKSIIGNIGIAHTRWATHGKPNKKNAHPQISDFIAVVHNGIIENYQQLRKELKNKSYKFSSETDTEVVAHLTHLELQNGGTLLEVVQRFIPQLKGSYGIVIMDTRRPNVLVAVKYKSPLIIGIGINENFLASDQLALLSVANYFIFLEDGDIAEITWEKIRIFNNYGIEVKRKKIINNLHGFNINKGKYKFYMEKEIYEQPLAIKNTINVHIDDNENVVFNELNKKDYDSILHKIEHIQIVACGTSYNAGMVARYWFESLINLPCDVEIASEYCYRKYALRKNSLFIILSQSGETADVLSALFISKKLNYLAILAICNVLTSTLVRESDFALITKAGFEISVASTKTFTSQLTILLLLIGYIGRIKYNNFFLEKQIVDELKLLPNYINNLFLQKNNIEHIAKDFIHKNHVFFLGRGVYYPIALEGALKLKEISYIHAEGYAAGELKHGPLALIDINMPVIMIAPTNKLLKKIHSNIEEICARKGFVYVFTDKNSNFIKNKSLEIIYLPNIRELVAPIFYIVPLQLLSYYIALMKGTNIDQPRNLAKSVTVE